MRLLLAVLLAAPVAVLVGINVGWRWVFAPLLALVLLRWTIASLRVLVTDGAHGAVEPTPVGSDERTLFWCEECGTEVLLLVRGTSRAPSHCGQRMHERTEIPN
jgi:hypothetical protein